MKKILAWLNKSDLRTALLLFFVLYIVCSRSSEAMTVDAKISNGQLTWISAQSSFGNGIAPSIWETPHGLSPTSFFIPGGGQTSLIPVTFIGPGNNAITLSLQMLGMEYVSPEAMALTVGADVGNTSDMGDAPVTLSGSLVTVIHDGRGSGLGDSYVKLNDGTSTLKTPFTHVRPVFTLTGSSGDILDSFSASGIVGGKYTATLFLPYFYDFYANNFGTSRRNLSIPITINIDYIPTVITNIEVNSPTGGVIASRYYSVGGVKKIQGQAIYNGVATGIFTNGLRMKLKPSDTYVMDEVSPDTTTSQIPYSVSCVECDITELVNNGIAVSDMDLIGTHIPGNNVSSINFTINVSFADVELSDLHTGDYQGRFSLLFELDM